MAHQKDNMTPWKLFVDEVCSPHWMCSRNEKGCVISAYEFMQPDLHTFAQPNPILYWAEVVKAFYSGKDGGDPAAVASASDTKE